MVWRGGSWAADTHHNAWAGTREWNPWERFAFEIRLLRLQAQGLDITRAHIGPEAAKRADVQGWFTQVDGTKSISPGQHAEAAIALVAMIEIVAMLMGKSFVKGTIRYIK